MQPTKEDRNVMLIKDNKPICLTRCYEDLPLEIPTYWKIVKYKPRSVFQWNRLQQFKLFPEPQNYHHMREWGQFLSFLQQSGMVAVVYTDHFNFYILAPENDQKCTYCVVRVWIRNSALASYYKENGVWAWRLYEAAKTKKKPYSYSYRCAATSCYLVLWQFGVFFSASGFIFHLRLLFFFSASGFFFSSRLLLVRLLVFLHRS
ncbi:uncharacterized protein LOC110096816 [Dendrobium catenatum]|uniref:uncharacterized protein LOC110096816 n=1 Tax=Dendrobium catenatum TaxID=906689 RepID=UPI00109FD651|nr:uncharacterized protein LOC110096816 [Dendrobium catenatum]